jgi:protein NrfC
VKNGKTRFSKKFQNFKGGIESMAEFRENKKGSVTRRQFLVGSGLVLAAGTLAACSPKTETVTEKVTEKATEKVTTTVTGPGTYAASTGYLLVDHIKCAGCMTCMMACSAANEGKVDLGLSRIQIVQDSFDVFPDDVRQYQCRQCTTPVCVINCPTGACKVDAANGNVRTIDQSKCAGCQTCLKSCPQTPHRTIWNDTTKKASKCDLCASAKYLGAGVKGGPGGVQACVNVCPMQAIKFTATMPDQTGDIGYDVNLRNANAVKIQISEVPVKA